MIDVGVKDLSRGPEGLNSFGDHVKHVINHQTNRGYAQNSLQKHNERRTRYAATSEI